MFNQGAVMLDRVVLVIIVVLCLVRPALAEPLPAALVTLMRDDPARFLEGTADLIAGFGVAGRLTAAGVEDHVALARAAARASALRRMLAMDLDNDGAVTLAELQVTQRAASATMRGRLQRQFEAADRDGDGRVAVGEMRGDAEAAAARSLTEAEAGAMRGLILMDRDGDGAVTMAEAEAALAALDEAT